MFTDYQPRYVCSVYYAPDDPHVTNPNQPGYVGPSGGGGGGGDDIQKLNAPGAPIPGGGVQPGTFGPGGSSGQMGAYNPDGSIPLDNGGSFGGLTLSPAGQQAPVEHFNVDTTPPFAVYPPGTPAPPEGTQLSSSDLSPTALALSAMTMPATGDNSDDQNKKREFGLNSDVVNGGGEDIQKLNAPGAPIPGGGVQPGPYGPGQPGGAGAYSPNGSIPAAPAAPAAATPPAAHSGLDYSPTVRNQVYTENGTEQLTRQEMIDRLRLAGNADVANDPNATNTALAQAMSNAYTTGHQNALAAKQAADDAQAARNATLDRLLPIVQADPAALPVINAILQQMGLPPMQTPAGVNPNGISLADWNAMPLDAQQLVLASFPGGPNGTEAKAFIAAMQAAAPPGKPAGPTTVHYAPLAA